MAKFLTRDGRHLAARCPAARQSPGRRVRIDHNAQWLAAARAVVPRCPDCWQAYEASLTPEERRSEAAELEQARMAATDADRELVEQILREREARTWAAPGARSSSAVMPWTRRSSQRWRLLSRLQPLPGR